MGNSEIGLYLILALALVGSVSGIIVQDLQEAELSMCQEQIKNDHKK